MTRQMRLSDLGLLARGGQNPTVTGVTINSRDVLHGALFAALPGTNVHGARFADQAVADGAAAVLTDAEGAAQITADVTLVVVENARAALASAAALWFGAQPETMVAVTGTNGKTSIASFVRQIFDMCGHQAVNLGTTGVEGAWTAPLAHTTPDPITLHHALAGAAEAGVTHGAMEASSHGIDQYRLDGVRLAAAGFSNFTQDHLDYHKTFEAYFAAKAALFTRLLPPDGVAVLNIDDPQVATLVPVITAQGQEVITIGQAEDARLRILGRRFDATGQVLRFSFDGTTYQKTLP